MTGIASGPPTRAKIPRELRRRSLRVAEAYPLPGGFVRVILTGPDIEGFESTGPTDHCKLVINDEGEHGRHYTPIPMPGAIAFDILTHGAGAVSRWAERLPIGDTVRVMGPRSSLEFPNNTSHLVLVGDAAAFPPLGRWLSHPSRTMRTDVVLHGPGGSYLEDREVATFREIPFDITGQALLDCVRSLTFTSGTYVWAGGEASSLVPLRRWLRTSAPAMKVDGYWKQGVADRDHHAPLDPEENE
ncbi:siderophore-interacting protein [Flaviflexus equikiangi]|uniref:siderophore-interacting protein n=1 Tax=Flaviflexus equikiangi TaxID=2758573 RepID=UPI0015F4B7B2|nr:siderophore-interacting protein [Flaviflexus equikiangi]